MKHKFKKLKKKTETNLLKLGQLLRNKSQNVKKTNNKKNLKNSQES